MYFFILIVSVVVQLEMTLVSYLSLTSHLEVSWMDNHDQEGSGALYLRFQIILFVSEGMVSHAGRFARKLAFSNNLNKGPNFDRNCLFHTFLRLFGFWAATSLSLRSVMKGHQNMTLSDYIFKTLIFLI